MTDFTRIGAAVIGTGFIGTVHIEALRRLGVNVAGVLGSTAERGAARAAALGVGKAYGSLEELLADPSGAGRARHLAQCRALCAGETDLGRGAACDLRKAVGDDLGAVRRNAGARPRQRQGRGGLLQYPLLSLEPACAADGGGWRAWRSAPCHRALSSGLAGQAHRLELAAGIE